MKVVVIRNVRTKAILDTYILAPGVTLPANMAKKLRRKGLEHILMDPIMMRNANHISTEVKQYPDLPSIISTDVLTKDPT